MAKDKGRALKKRRRAPTNRKRGRPAWIPTGTINERAKQYAMRGLTLKQIAAALGIARSTFAEKQNEFAEFSEAIRQGQAEGIAVVANKHFENAVRGKGNIQAQQFILKNQAGWSEKMALSPAADPEGPKPMERQTQELRDELKLKMAKLAAGGKSE